MRYVYADLNTKLSAMKKKRSKKAGYEGARKKSLVKRKLRTIEAGIEERTSSPTTVTTTILST